MFAIVMAVLSYVRAAVTILRGNPQMQECKYIFDKHYRITESGEIYSVYKKNTKLKTRMKCDQSGNTYEEVTLFGAGGSHLYAVYKVYAEAFVDNPNGYETVVAVDGNYTNYCVDNFMWVDEASDKRTEFKKKKKIPKNYFVCKKCGRLTKYSDGLCSNCQRITLLEEAEKSGNIDVEALSAKGKIVLELYQNNVSYVTLGKLSQRNVGYVRKAFVSPTTEKIMNLSRFLIMPKAKELLEIKKDL